MKLCTPGARDSLIITLEYILNQTKPGYFLGQKMAPNDHKFKMLYGFIAKLSLSSSFSISKNSFFRSLN